MTFFNKVHGDLTRVCGNDVDKLCRTLAFVKAFDVGLSENAFHIVDFFMAFNQTLSFFNIIVFRISRVSLINAVVARKSAANSLKQHQKIEHSYVGGSLLGGQPSA